MDLSRIEDASGFRGRADEFHAPGSEAELAALLKQASSLHIPVTAGGAWTGVTGGSVPDGGWVVSLEKFRRLEIGRGEARVGAGVALQDLQAAAARSRQFYAPDPTETTASLGGTIATNASGARSFRYGPTRNHVRALRVALADGSVREFERGEAIGFPVPEVRRPSCRKHSAGYPLAPGMDWVDLFVGSEGTLGVVIEATVGLLPAPRELLTGVIFFPSDLEALQAVDRWRPRPALRMLEYMDEHSLELLRPGWPELPPRARAALLIEDEGDVDEWADDVPDESWFAAGTQDRERLRRFRHALPEAVNHLVRSRGLTKMGTDFAVPAERNGDMLGYYRERLEAEFRDQYLIFGHIGDAHLHVNVLPRTAEESEGAARLFVDFARTAVAFGGTVSAEHGLGKKKAHLLAIQYSAAEIDAMRDVKTRLDPDWLLGRGTLFPSFR